MEETNKSNNHDKCLNDEHLEDVNGGIDLEVKERIQREIEEAFRQVGSGKETTLYK